MKVLLAEDDVYLGELIVHLLKKKGDEHVDWVHEGEDAYDYALASFYDVIILDWMLPNGDGVSVCQRLRKHGYHGAILMLTAKDAATRHANVRMDSFHYDHVIKGFARMEEKIMLLEAEAKARSVIQTMPPQSFDIEVEQQLKQLKGE
ncbi:response regulator [Anoxybacillus ayderensis]|uniref:response regulator n=1 Tax=Anoxybacillus ayderensis TaxID=265546 RepID=UPI00399C7BB7